MSPRTYEKAARAVGEERTRTALLDAAERAFLAGRWSAASLTALAHEAGVTKQTLLRHFGSKDGLLERAVQRALDRTARQRLGPPPPDVAAAVDDLLDHYARDGERALALEALEGTGAVAVVRDRARALHHAWVDHAFAPWLAGPERERRRAATIALCDVRAWAVLSRDLGLGRDEVHATLTLALDRLLGPAP
ncbi:TetR/AcrR family transcriptional regulator [Conexibacter sp. SYSU D00693]|uniref:TetR/AcrR family transcriptional regulator n=1 Tax=Conexibacter sp. SYSU D00693 TaxID=2812560 RepID=UPI00196B5277|nr:TetR/AcrR family transcriptional regulator [Conexibacter sp. SYSU D00693]